MEKKLHRVPDQAVFGGVASGLAQYFNIDVVIVRVALVVMLLISFIPPGFLMTGFVYVILWVVLPTGPATPATGQSGFEFLSSDSSSDNKRSERSVMILGGVLIFFGVLMLVDHFPIWFHIQRYFWPLALIAAGAFLILRQRDKQQEKNHTVYPTTPPPSDPVSPAPFEPDPQPYTPFGTNTATHFPEDPENKKPDEDSDDQIIKVN